MSNEVPAPRTDSGEIPTDVAILQHKYAELKKRFSSLIDASRRINGTLDINIVLNEVLESARSLTGARFGVLLTNDESGGVRQIFTSGMTSEDRSSIENAPTRAGLLEYLNETQEPVRLSNIASHPESVVFSESLPQMKTFLGMQIRHGEEHVGNFFLTEKEDGQEFTEEDEETMVLLVPQSATAISNANRYENERRSRADLEALLDISPIAVAVFDAKTGQMVSYNPEFKRLAGDQLTMDTEWEEALPLWSFRHADGREIPISELPMNRVFLFGETVRAEDIVVYLPDGRTIPTLVSAAPIYSEQGDLIAGMVAVQDMTSMADLERVRTQFLGLVSEDLRMPLATIKGSVAALSEVAGAQAQDESHQLLRIIDQQTDLMRSQVNSLVELTYIETGKLSISPEAADIPDLLNEAKEEFVRGHQGVKIEADAPVGLPQVMADKQRIGQVLNNLLYSVARHTTDLSSIKVSASQIDIYVAISVSANSGVMADGEPQQLVRRMLGSQLQDIRKAAGGESLALAMCKGIVEAHGGRMHVENEETGSGLSISFTIPVAEEREENPDLSGLQPLERDAFSATDELRVLVAMDDPRARGTVRQTLSRAGFIPITGNELDTVDRTIEDEKPHLLLLDLSSNRVSGFQLLQRLSNDYDVPIIVLSGQGDEENIVRAFDMGADDYIVKPFSPTELVARIKASLRKQASGRRSEFSESYQWGEVAIDYAGHTVTVAGSPVHLTATEYHLLVELSTKAGRVVSQDELLQQVWGPEYSGESQLLRSYVKSLRQKLGDNARSPSYIFTEHGIGYRMQKP